DWPDRQLPPRTVALTRRSVLVTEQGEHLVAGRAVCCDEDPHRLPRDLARHCRETCRELRRKRLRDVGGLSQGQFYSHERSCPLRARHGELTAERVDSIDE